jgi:hypothetical protein
MANGETKDKRWYNHTDWALKHYNNGIWLPCAICNNYFIKALPTEYHRVDIYIFIYATGYLILFCSESILSMRESSLL